MTRFRIAHYGWFNLQFILIKHSKLDVIVLDGSKWIMKAFKAVCYCVGHAYGANMGPIWVPQDPGGPQVGPMNFAI